MTTSFVGELAKILKVDLSDREMAIAVTGAAMAMLEKATSGEPIVDPMTFQQLGAVTAALHWHSSPAMRANVRVRSKDGQ